MQNLANPTNNGAEHTDRIFAMGVTAGLTQAAERTRLRATARHMARIERLPATQRDYAYATLAAATLPAGTR